MGDAKLGDALDIEFDNGNAVIIEMKNILSKPKFASLAEDDRIFYPHTDGDCVYWNVTPRISMTLAEIIELLGELPIGETCGPAPEFGQQHKD